MDFFAQQDAARRSTRRLVLYFVLAVVAIVLAVYVTVRLILFGISAQTGHIGEGSMPLLDPGLFALTAGLTLAVIVAGSLYKMIALREGGDAVAWMLGGRLVDPETSSPAERRLLNVVEEMALASGVPVPHVYVLDKETAINAFAAGYSPSDAAIGITDGALRRLGRDELQGVIGHEFSHLLNGDMRLNLRLMGILHGILVIALIGTMILRSVYWTGGGSRDRKGGGSLGLAVLLFGASLVAVGYIGVFFGRLIKSAVSRQREYLADAASVQFTRDPTGLSGALQKIGGHTGGSRLRSPRAEEASHMFFGNGVKQRFFAAALATHPPLGDRIRRIDPGWSGEFAEVAPPTTTPAPTAAGQRSAEAGAAVIGAAIAGAAVATGAAASTATPGAAATEAPGGPAGGVTPDSVSARIGTLSDVHLAYARSLLAGLPEGLHEAVHETEGAEAVVYALLLARDPGVRGQQLDLLAARVEPSALARTHELAERVAACPVEARLPLLDLAVPALARLSLGRYQTFLTSVDALIRADRRVDLFEYTLERLLRVHLEPRYSPQRPPATHYYRLNRLGAECSLLLSALAHSGQARPEDAARAFAAGAGELPAGVDGLGLIERAACGMEAIDRALDELARTSPPLKRHLVRAATATVAFDHRVTVAEGELLRALADSLGCPVPPFLPGQVAAQEDVQRGSELG